MRVVHEGLPIDITAQTDDNVLMRTRLLSRAVTDIYDGKLRPFGISAIHFALLDAIGRTEPTTRAALARIEHLDKSTLTRNLKSILYEGWVQEIREGANGRTRPIVLTKSGKQLGLDARPAWLAAQNEVKALLGQERVRAIMDSVERITKMADHAETTDQLPANSRLTQAD
jgi:DNA-binding MarR family transcriptional regulator